MKDDDAAEHSTHLKAFKNFVNHFFARYGGLVVTPKVYLLGKKNRVGIARKVFYADFPLQHKTKSPFKEKK